MPLGQGLAGVALPILELQDLMRKVAPAHVSAPGRALGQRF